MMPRTTLSRTAVVCVLLIALTVVIWGTGSATAACAFLFGFVLRGEIMLWTHEVKLAPKTLNKPNERK